MLTLKSESARPGDLALEDRARRMRHVLAVMIDHVAEHQRGALEPGNPAQGREVWAYGEVAVAEIPGRRGVARDRLHLHVHREQVIAGMHLVDHLVDEEMAGHPLAEQPPLHVGEADQDGVDRPGRDVLLQRVELEIAAHVPEGPTR